MEVLWEKMEVLEEEEANKTMKKHVMWGKTKKFFLNKTLFVQNTRFSWLEWVANKSLSQVAKNTWQKFEKIWLSVFHDWEVHSRESHEESCESF